MLGVNSLVNPNFISKDEISAAGMHCDTTRGVEGRNLIMINPPITRRKRYKGLIMAFTGNTCPVIQLAPVS
jgi:hypothetical protein